MLPEIELVSPSTPLTEIITRMMVSSHSHFFMVKDNNRICGHISLETLRPILKDYETVHDVVIASDLMDQGITVVNSEESLDIVMKVFGKFNLDEIPVADKGESVGIVRRSDVIEAYNREIFRLDMASSLATSLRLQQKMHSRRWALEGGFQIIEVNAANDLIGKSLEVLKLRERFGATGLRFREEPKMRMGRYPISSPPLLLL